MGANAYCLSDTHRTANIYKRWKAGILKDVGIHGLRQSVATHPLDKGTDVAIIMKLLGHNDLKTTLRYLHVTNRDILKLVSPLDDLPL